MERRRKPYRDRKYGLVPEHVDRAVEEHDLAELLGSYLLRETQEHRVHWVQNLDNCRQNTTLEGFDAAFQLDGRTYACTVQVWRGRAEITLMQPDGRIYGFETGMILQNVASPAIARLYNRVTGAQDLHDAREALRSSLERALDDRSS